MRIIHYFKKTALEGDFEFYAKLFCDDMTASTNIFRLNSLNKKEINNLKKENLQKEKGVSCNYKIVNDFVVGENVIKNRKDSKVKSAGKLESVKAIILHRTVGTSISGAISHSKGTHFYIEGGKDAETDGVIFQAISLNKSSNHILDEKTRISHFDIKSNNSIGIEVVGMAYFKKGGKLYKNAKGFPEVKDMPILSKEYIDQVGIENYWDVLTEKQIKSVLCLVKLLMETYNIKPEMILTHEEIQIKTAGEGQTVKDAIFNQLIK